MERQSCFLSDTRAKQRTRDSLVGSCEYCHDSIAKNLTLDRGPSRFSNSRPHVCIQTAGPGTECGIAKLLGERR